MEVVRVPWVRKPLAGEGEEVMKRQIATLRQAYGVDPCPKCAKLCPIPEKGRLMPCNWGHVALEFAEHCDTCAEKVVQALGRLSFAQRYHHHRGRAK